MNTSLNFSFPKSRRLLKRNQYRCVVQEGEQHVGKKIVIYCRRRNVIPIRLGLIVSTKFGKAHERNRFKRVVREAFRLIWHRLPGGIDIGVKPRYRAAQVGVREVIEELLYFLGN